ncbi:MAG: ferritin-like domain-containing protein [Methyloceanibacter sp.]|uniref:YciE/YciF ferroxidase family protein n=1 Tax=Methyloceanibacter sp. TaxID=1965321 RepID=UPI003D9B691D
MSTVKSLEDLFVHHLKDIYYAEKQIVKALPKMAKKADSDKLRKAFEDHLKETEGQVKRLEQVFELFGVKAAGETCPAIEGIIKEGEEGIKDAKDPDVRDAGMIADAQAVEHYEISRYGTLIAWAKQLGKKEAASLLQQTLDQEYKADQLLSKLAEGQLNKEAA